MDPRFESLAGRFDQGRFRKQYAFLYEEALPQQKAELKAAAKVRACCSRAWSLGSCITPKSLQRWIYIALMLCRARLTAGATACCVIVKAIVDRI